LLLFLFFYKKNLHWELGNQFSEVDGTAFFYFTSYFSYSLILTNVRTIYYYAWM